MIDPKQLAFYEKVRELAFYLYVCRRSPDGRALNHWLEAEKRMKECLSEEHRDEQP